ncbi:3-hydroxyisobutyrate dehydrogenase [Alphaproteobacteria bacterium]|nr:3-hydroxyisobutyrate dehydrogenase [Alphaproteobacteria bacterium]MDC1023064.1 3-hydroxyisobutyrate dehydrogenase [Alphaproteobacteria bacterium]
MKKIGFIGLGNMGSQMVVNLLKNNYQVVGYDINEKFIDQLIPNGLKKASNLDEIPNDIDVLITMLPNGEIVDQVYDSIINRLKPMTLITDCSTIDVNTAKNLHKKCKDNNLLSLDAPVSGGVVGATNGTLTFMVGGNEKAYELMSPLFEAMGKKSVLCGLASSGQAAKACNNMLLATTMIGVGEAFNLGNNLGLDPQKLFDILSTSTGSCWAINTYCPIEGVGPISPADKKFQPGFSASLMLKDLSIALKAIEYTKTSAPFGTKAQENFKRMVVDNKGELDFSAIINFNK